MLCSDMQKVARTGTTADVQMMLKAYGHSGAFVDGAQTGNCIDYIIAGINEAENPEERTKKQALITDYVQKTGVFKDEKQIAPDAAAEFRETILLLTEQVLNLTEEVARLSAKFDEQAKPAAKKAAAKQAADVPPTPIKDKTAVQPFGALRSMNT